MSETVAIIDYRSGNLHSAAKAFERAAAGMDRAYRIIVTDRLDAIAAADRIVLPGVGAFADCRAGLRAIDGLWDLIDARVSRQATPFFGICVGMQLMAQRGLEFGTHDGFGWLAGDISALEPADPALHIPHMGWNALVPTAAGADHPLLSGITRGDHVYFVHSYALRGGERADILAQADHGGAFPAIVGRETMVGTQFHPEKSQRVGLTLIGNFLKWRP